MVSETKVLVTGIVQGVGFRPFCARIAMELSLAGSVKNTSHGVEILLRGEKDVINHYLARLQNENPDASAISSVQILYEKESESPSSRHFIISRSEKHDRQRVLIPPDIATCADCLKEMTDPSNRRYGYPFINCTNCGPRYTIIQDLPYDRPKTTMASFRMCNDCSEEYQCITDRRYHAQPNACHVCGPSLWLTDNTGRKILGKDEDPLKKFIQKIKSGNIGAVKGLGGFHLTCDAFNDIPVRRLRD
ncbi:MAG TPA: acylphosphatase, partial [Synergistales bacterium]|nr:acylphosphatase [Synergistales bacterium]